MNKNKIATGLVGLVALILSYVIIFGTDIIEYAYSIENRLVLSVLVSVLILILLDEYNRRR